MSTPLNNIANAVGAYQNTSRNGAGPSVEARGSGQGAQFADLVKGAIQEAIKIGEQSERVSMAAINDRADINQVVTAIAEAETTLKTVVAVRDKVLDAYKEILRMPM